MKVEQTKNRDRNREALCCKEHLQKLPPEYYVKNNTGDLITKCIQDTTTIRQMLGMGLVGLIDVLTTNVVTILYMVKTTDVRLTLLAVIPIPFLLFALIKLRSEMRRITPV